MTTCLEDFRIGDRGDESACKQWTDAGYLHQPATKLCAPGACENAAIILQDLMLHDGKLRREHLEAKTCIIRDTIIAFIFDDLEQSINAEPANRGNHAELRYMRPDRVRELCALTVQH